jgi:hypothetical protein
MVEAAQTLRFQTGTSSPAGILDLSFTIRGGGRMMPLAWYSFLAEFFRRHGLQRAQSVCTVTTFGSKLTPSIRTLISFASVRDVIKINSNIRRLMLSPLLKSLQDTRHSVPSPPN